jgi:hypothetical protein
MAGRNVTAERFVDFVHGTSEGVKLCSSLPALL